MFVSSPTSFAKIKVAQRTKSTSEQNRNSIMRIRRGYDDFNRLLFECVYWEKKKITA